MGSAKSILGLLNRLESPYIRVYQHRCAKVRNRNASCARCADACTTGAIGMTDEGLRVSPERCIGCGTCATVCPTCALEAHNPSDAALFDACAHALAETGQGTVCIACEQIADAAAGVLDAEKLVRVRCLGRVEESLLVLLACIGARRVRLVRDACDTCVHASGGQAAQAACATANELISAWGGTCEARLTSTFPRCVRLARDAGYDAARRAFFAGSRDVATQVGSAGAGCIVDEALDAPAVEQVRYVHVGADKTLPHFIPPRRRRLLEGLHELGKPRAGTIRTRLWGHVRIDPARCTSCRMCATFCPTGAIRKFDRPDGTFGIDHFPGACVKCRCCESICSVGALQIDDDVDIAVIVDGSCERHAMAPRGYTAGDIGAIHERVRQLTGLEDVYDH